MTIDATEEFRARVRAFCRDKLPAGLTRKVQRNDVLDKQDYLSYLKVLDEQGWAAGHWPQAYGGCGWSPLERFIFEEETSMAGAPWLIPFGISYVGPIIYTFGNEAQKQRFLPPIRNSSEWWAQGYSEPGAGSDLAGLRTRAVRDGDFYVVTGQKTWTTYVQWADWMFCLVRTSDEDRPQRGISFLLIDMKSPGITIRPIATMDKYAHVNEVFLDEVRVPVANLVGEEGKGWTYGKVLLANERVLVAEVGRSTRQLARLETLADRMLRGAASSVRSAAFESRIAELRLRLFVLRALCYREVAASMAGSEPGAEASMMKIRGSALQQDIAEAMVDLLGLAGAAAHPGAPLATVAALSDSVDISAFPGMLRDHLHSRATTIYGGSNEIQRNIIAKTLGL